MNFKNYDSRFYHPKLKKIFSTTEGLFLLLNELIPEEPRLLQGVIIRANVRFLSFFIKISPPLNLTVIYIT